MSAPQDWRGFGRQDLLPRPNSETRCERRRGAARLGDSTILPLWPFGRLSSPGGVLQSDRKRYGVAARRALFLRNHLPDIVVVNLGGHEAVETLRFIGDALGGPDEYPIPEDEMRAPVSSFKPSSLCRCRGRSDRVAPMA